MGVLDQHVPQEYHICTLETKFVKNIEISYRSKNVLDRASVKTIFFPIHSHLIYGNIVWANTNILKLQAIHILKKHGTQIISSKDMLFHSRSLLQSLNLPTPQFHA